MDLGHNPHFQNPFSAGGVMSINHDTGGGDRFPQWSVDETRDFLMIRAELDPNFMETKRNKVLWEVISTRMKEMGYNRTPEQCKCKWKNLVTRYKGCETMLQAEGRKQFPFYNEMQTIFTARMHRMLWLDQAEGGGATATATSKQKAAVAAQFSSSEDYENEVDEREKGRAKKKRKTVINGNPIVNGIREVMDAFMKQRMETEMQWLKAYEEREEERKSKEMEWRQKMEEMESERLIMNKRLMETYEQRKIRDEVRADKRDALVNVLLIKLRREGR